MPRAPKTSVYLVTLDEGLWPQIGQRLDKHSVLKQVDTVEELRSTARAGQPGVVIYDARGVENPASELSRLQLHSAAFAIVVLDAPEQQDRWRSARRQHQIIAALAVPFGEAGFLETLSNASEECHARAVVLDEGGAGAPAVPATGRKTPWIVLWIAAALAGCGLAFLIYRYAAAPSTPSTAHPTAAAPAVAPAATPSAAPASTPAASEAASVPAASEPGPGSEEKADALLEKARQAMLDRRYIDPASNNALSLYQNVLAYDPGNGEAHQGLQRLEQILVARVQSYLDDKKYDLALQALETARSLNPSDPKLSELDARVALLRAELGSTQIQAAINAKNYDRASELIEDATRAKSLSAAKLAQLREDVRRRRADSDAAGVLSLLAQRLQQDKLLDPPSDSAVYYLKEARLAGASASDLEQPTQELGRRLAQAARTALDDHRPADAERLVDEAQKVAGPAKLIAAVRSDLSAQRDAQARDKALRAQNLQLAQSRLAQGQLLEPANDSALYYLNQVRAADPSNPQVPQLSATLESAIVVRARAALDSGDAAGAGSMAAAASALGASPELDALREALARAPTKPGALGAATTVSADTLIAVKPLRLEYPRDALANGTEGWVDLAFTVTSEGKVTNVNVVRSSPRYVFDVAARNALLRVRYRPVMLDGRAIEVASTLRVAFKLTKP